MGHEHTHSAGDGLRALVDYLGGLTLSGGDHDGARFEVLGWERRFIRGAFGQPGDAALSLARGNGKSALCAAIACAVVDPAGPLHRRRAEVVCVAASFKQARIVFEDVREFLAGRYDLDARRTWRKQDSANSAELEHKPSGARVRCIGSDPANAHGLRPLLVLADEPAEWPPGTSRRMLSALRTGLGKMPRSKLIALGTRPASAHHWFAQLLDTAPYAQCHAARPDDPPFWRRTWKRANPSLDHLPSLEEELRIEAVNARRDPDSRSEFNSRRLNLGTADTAESWLVDPERWADALALATPEASGPYVLGIDLGDEAAMTAAAGYWRTGRLDAFAAFPAIPTLAERGKRDGVEGAYLAMAERGELVCHPGRTSKPRLLVTEALLRWGQPVAVVADAHRKGELLDALEGSGMAAVPVVIRRMGPFDGGEDRADFHRAILEGLARPTDNRLLDSAVSEARTVLSPKGGMRHLAKGTAGGRRLRARDDAAAAAVLAVAAGWREWHSKPATTARLLVGSVG